MKSFIEHIKDDLDAYFSIVEKFDVVLSKTHEKINFGTVGGIPLYFWNSPKSEYLVSSGWQGKEEAGIIASYKLSNGPLMEKISFFPMACASCLLSRSSTNFNFLSADRKFNSSSEEEVEIIKNNINILTKSSVRGHFALHEDPRRSFPYYYIWGNMDLELVEKVFKKHFQSPWKLKWSPNGEGMFCEYIHSQGIPFSIQLETPADGSYPLEKRSSCLSEIVSNYIRYYAE